MIISKTAFLWSSNSSYLLFPESNCNNLLRLEFHNISEIWNKEGDFFFRFINEPDTYDIDSQFLWGPALMIIPVLEVAWNQFQFFI